MLKKLSCLFIMFLCCAVFNSAAYATTFSYTDKFTSLNDTDQASYHYVDLIQLGYNNVYDSSFFDKNYVATAGGATGKITYTFPQIDKIDIVVYSAKKNLTASQVATNVTSSVGQKSIISTEYSPDNVNVCVNLRISGLKQKSVTITFTDKVKIEKIELQVTSTPVNDVAKEDSTKKETTSKKSTTTKKKSTTQKSSSYSSGRISGSSGSSSSSQKEESSNENVAGQNNVVMAKARDDKAVLYIGGIFAVLLICYFLKLVLDFFTKKKDEEQKEKPEKERESVSFLASNERKEEKETSKTEETVTNEEKNLKEEKAEEKILYS